MTTIRDIAAQLGVSVATVSRVLNGYPDVAPSTRARVLAAIEEHDYTPVRAARSLVTGRTHVIGVVLETGDGHPDLQHPFFQEVLVGLKHAVGELGYDLLLFSTEVGGNGSAHAATQRYLARARQHRVDGVVLMGADRHAPQIEELVASEVPTVGIDLDLDGERAGHVMSDNVAGAGLAVRYLADLGHTRIALIGGPQDSRPGVDRLLGYRRELLRLGLAHRPRFVREGDFYPGSGYAEMMALLSLPEPPTAVFVAADLMAAGAMRAVTERGLRCPDDVSMVGFDDVQLAELLQPPLTTIRQDKRRIGRAAGEGLIRAIDDPAVAPPVHVVPVELVIRASAAPPRADVPGTRGGSGGMERSVAREGGAV